MRIINKLILFISLLTFSSIPCFAQANKEGAMSRAKNAAKQSANKTSKNQMQDLNRPIIATRTSQVISFKLKANPTTGFSWFLLKYNQELLTPMNAKFTPPKKMMPGAPGFMLWQFRVKTTAFVVPQITHIDLLYARPWDLSSSMKKTITVVIQ